MTNQLHQRQPHMEKKYFKNRIPENAQCANCKMYYAKKTRFYWLCPTCKNYILCAGCKTEEKYLTHLCFIKENKDEPEVFMLSGTSGRGNYEDNMSSSPEITFMMSYLSGRYCDDFF